MSFEAYTGIIIFLSGGSEINIIVRGSEINVIVRGSEIKYYPGYRFIIIILDSRL